MSQDLGDMLSAFLFLSLREVGQRLLPQRRILIPVSAASFDDHGVGLVIHVISEHMLIPAKAQHETTTRDSEPHALTSLPLRISRESQGGSRAFDKEPKRDRCCNLS